MLIKPPVSFMIFADKRPQFDVYFPCLNACLALCSVLFLSTSRRFQQGEGPNRGLLQALLPSVDSLTALVTMMVQVTHVENEKRILAAVSHPFIVRLVSAGLDTRLVLCSDPSVSQPVFTIMEKAPTRAFAWLKAPTSTFTFKTLLRH